MKKLSIKSFKNELRLVTSDVWGSPMEAWFECAGHLFKRDAPIPNEWQYNPGICGDGTDKESYWYDIFKTTKTEDLILIANLLFRYCSYLRFKKLDY